jgi:hypothetical protein
MIQNFNTMAEMIGAVYYTKAELEDDKGNPTRRQMILRRKLAEKYLPQLNFDEIDEIVKDVDLEAGDEAMQDKVNQLTINKDDLKQADENS